MGSKTVIDLITAITGLLWPVLAFVALLFFKKELLGLMGRVQKGEISGFKFELQNKVDSLTTDVAVLQFLVNSFVTDYQRKHLVALQREGEYAYKKAGGRIVEEMIWLWDHGLVDKKDPSMSFYSLPDVGNLKDYCFITERGKQYLIHAAALEDKNRSGDK